MAVEVRPGRAPALKLLQKSLELHGFEFREFDFGNQISARYRKAHTLIDVKRFGTSEEMLFSIYEQCIEFLETREKLKGE